jgi:hypothetical protein
LFWTLFVYATIAVTLPLSTVPRYYTPLLPIILLAWLLLAVRVAVRARRRYGTGGGELIIALSILLIFITNLGRLGREVADQRWKDVGRRSGWIEELEMADRIAESVPPDARIIGPNGAPVMSYFSGRTVVTAREILPNARRKPEPHWPRHIAALNITHAIFPSTLYTEQESKIGDLMDKGVIVPGRVLARVNPRESDPPMVLCEVTIKVPPEGVDWRKRPSTRAASTEIIQQTSAASREEKAARERSRRAAAKRARDAKQARAEARARKEYKAYKAMKVEKAARAARHAARERREARERKSARGSADATTAPTTTAPVSPPATQTSINRASDRKGEPLSRNASSQPGAAPHSNTALQPNAP